MKECSVDYSTPMWRCKRFKTCVESCVLPTDSRCYLHVDATGLERIDVFDEGTQCLASVEFSEPVCLFNCDFVQGFQLQQILLFSVVLWVLFRTLNVHVHLLLSHCFLHATSAVCEALLSDCKLLKVRNVVSSFYFLSLICDFSLSYSFLIMDRIMKVFT